MVFKGVQTLTQASRITLCHDFLHSRVLFTSRSCGSRIAQKVPLLPLLLTAVHRSGPGERCPRLPALRGMNISQPMGDSGITFICFACVCARASSALPTKPPVSHHEFSRAYLLIISQRWTPPLPMVKTQQLRIPPLFNAATDGRRAAAPSRQSPALLTEGCAASRRQGVQ